MLRIAFALAVLVNGLLLAYHQGWLDTLIGLNSRGDHQPERLQQQLHPEQVQIIQAQQVSKLQAKACLEFGPVHGNEAFQRIVAALTAQGVASTDYDTHATDVPGQWAVATIRFPNKEFQLRKEETYKRLRIDYEYIAGPPEEVPTMLLSRHPSEKAAVAAMDAMMARNLKGLRVLQVRVPETLHHLRFAQADGALQARLQRVSALGASKVCAPAAPSSAASMAVASPVR